MSDRKADVETVWRLIGTSTKPLTCAIHAIDSTGVEVRVGFSDVDILFSQRVVDVEHARALAERWRLDVLARGFDGVPLP